MVFTSERLDIVSNPKQRKPLVLEAKVAIDLRLIAGQESEHRQAVPDVDPHFGAFCRNVLGLRAQSVRGPELQVPERESNDKCGRVYIGSWRAHPP